MAGPENRCLWLSRSPRLPSDALPQFVYEDAGIEPEHLTQVVHELTDSDGEFPSNTLGPRG